MLAWRICREATAGSAFDGEGARLYPGRWNHRGVPVVYCASTLSLASLELFVHLDPDDLPSDLVSVRVDVPDALVETLDRKKLPRGWRAYPAPVELQDLGSEWVLSLRSVALRVPSAVLPIEENILLNPHHARMAKLTIDPPEAFAFDPRMFK
jgi:RES domain-containing protein